MAAAIRSNTSFGTARVEVGAEKAFADVPPEYKGTFAFFEPGGRNTTARVMVLDPKGRHWQDNARYEFLKNAPVVPVLREGRRESRSAVTFFQDRASKQLFAVVHDSASGRFYLMGADNALDLLDHIGPPPAKSGAPVRVHLQMSNILPRPAPEMT